MAKQAGEELLAEEDGDDRQVEVGVAERDVAPIEHPGDAVRDGVVEDVLWLEIAVQQRRRGPLGLMVLFVAREDVVQARDVRGGQEVAQAAGQVALRGVIGAGEELLGDAGLAGGVHREGVQRVEEAGEVRQHGVLRAGGQGVEAGGGERGSGDRAVPGEDELLVAPSDVLDGWDRERQHALQRG